MKNLQKIHEQVLEVAKQASAIAESYFGKVQNSYDVKESKGNRTIVTEADTQINSFLIDRLTKIFDAAVIGEEESKLKDSEYYWIIDPIDGTSNFQKGLDTWGISIALWNKTEPEYGLIYLPRIHEKYMYTIKDKGVFGSLSNQIELKPTSGLKNTICIGTGNDTFKRNFFDSELPIKCSFRSFGAAIIDGYYLLSGALDIIGFDGLSGWDIAAILPMFKQLGLQVDFIDAMPLPTDSAFKEPSFKLVIYKPDAEMEYVNELKSIMTKSKAQN